MNAVKYIHNVCSNCFHIWTAKSRMIRHCKNISIMLDHQLWAGQQWIRMEVSKDLVWSRLLPSLNRLPCILKPPTFIAGGLNSWRHIGRRCWMPMAITSKTKYKLHKIWSIFLFSIIKRTELFWLPDISMAYFCSLNLFHFLHFPFLSCSGVRRNPLLHPAAGTTKIVSGRVATVMLMELRLTMELAFWQCY